MASIDPAPAKESLPKDKAVAGIALYIAAVLLIVIMNAFAKQAAAWHDPVEIVFYRGLVAMTLLLAWAGGTGQRHIYKTRRILSHLKRSLAGNIGVILVFWSYALMPMADATALLFAAPLMVTALSALMLGEKVGPWRWAAVAAGLIGVTFIARPSGEHYAAYAVAVALGAAFSNALVSIFLRDLGRTEDALTTVFYFLGFGILFSGIYMIFRGSPPQMAALLPLAGTGIAGGLQLIIKTQAYRWAEASLLSPFSYTSILWATLIGWVFWGNLPTAWTVSGAAIVIASNLFILWREKRKSGRH